MTMVSAACGYNVKHIEAETSDPKISILLYTLDPKYINFSGEKLPHITFRYITTPTKKGPPNPLADSAYSHFFTTTICSIFSIYIDQAVKWMKSEHGHDYPKWPNTINFCRVVRNACVHNGKVNIRSATSPKVSWRNLTIDHNDYGLKITDKIRLFDFFGLLLDLENELDSFGAPNPLP